MWTDFFVAAAGASAALAGLVIVAISVNINRILEHSNLPARAAAAISALILILVSSMAALIPQRAANLGIEIIVFGACCWFLEVSSLRKSIASPRPLSEKLIELVLGQVQVLPFFIGGIRLAAGNENGLYWVATGVIAVFIASTLNAWVLLVEILR